MRFGSAAAIAALVMAVGGSAASTANAAYQRLHVTALALHADRPHVRVAEPFHLYLHAHVRENVPEIDDVVLPNLAGFTVDADERSERAGPNGTDYVETLTLEAVAEGTFVIGPATCSVFDTLANRALRYSSNRVTIVVAPVAPPEPFAGAADLLAQALRIVATIVGIFAAIVVFIVLFGRRKKKTAPPPLPVLAPIAEPAPRDTFADTITFLRERRDREAARAARAALWQRAGAPEGSTLSQVLAAHGSLEAGMRSALIAAERAAFVEPDRFQTAVDALIDALECLENVRA